MRVLNSIDAFSSFLSLFCVMSYRHNVFDAGLERVRKVEYDDPVQADLVKRGRDPFRDGSRTVGPAVR
jgi:hypothetical protein